MKKKLYIKEATVTATANSFQPDKNADKSGTDADSDKTHKRKEAGKFDKPEKEVDPDTTGTDIDSDKTKKNIEKLK